MFKLTMKVIETDRDFKMMRAIVMGFGDVPGMPALISAVLCFEDGKVMPRVIPRRSLDTATDIYMVEDRRGDARDGAPMVVGIPKV